MLLGERIFANGGHDCRQLLGTFFGDDDQRRACGRSPMVLWGKKIEDGGVTRRRTMLGGTAVRQRAMRRLLLIRSSNALNNAMQQPDPDAAGQDALGKQ